MTSKTVAKRGPKSPEGKLAVRFNASTHGILSLQPIVNAYERTQDWESHRASSSKCGQSACLAVGAALRSYRQTRV